MPQHERGSLAGAHPPERDVHPAADVSPQCQPVRPGLRGRQLRRVVLVHALEVTLAPLSCPQHVEGAVRGDPIEPAPDLRALVEAIEAAVGLQEGLLDDILGVVRVPRHSIGQAEEGAPVAVDQQAEGLAVAGFGSRHCRRLVHSKAQTLGEDIG